MSINTIEQGFIDKVSTQVSLSADGKDRFRVLTPFQFEDGDELVIVLKKEGERWLLSDEAHTYRHLTYDIDEKLLYSGTRWKLISKALSMFEVEDRNGELVLDVSDESYGEALYDFVQALLKITDVSYLSREQVRSTFIEDFRALLYDKVSESRMTFDWWDQDHDPDKVYTVDCCINGMPKPLFVYALSSGSKALTAAWALHQFEEWGIPFRSLGILEDKSVMTRKEFAIFRNVWGTYFTGINESREEIEHFLEENAPEENTSVDGLSSQTVS
jgi:hypothetical protein